MARERKPLKDRARSTIRDLLGGGRFTCACCPGKEFRGHRALNAHHLARHAGRWSSEAARKAARKMGKDVDRARRHARGWLEAAGYRDDKGRKTDKARARPELRGRLKIRDLRQAHQHDRAHGRTEKRAGKRERRAGKAHARGRTDWGDIHTVRAADIRERHSLRWPQRQPATPRTPEPSRPARTPPVPNGHSNGRANGRTREPASTGRTR